jgi:hypothetical protein
MNIKKRIRSFFVLKYDYDTNNNKRRIFIGEHDYKRDDLFDQIEFEFIDGVEAESFIERNYILWLTHDHYTKTILQCYGYSANKMLAFEEYTNKIRVLITGHCCPKHELRRAFDIYDQN